MKTAEKSECMLKPGHRGVCIDKHCHWVADSHDEIKAMSDYTSDWKTAPTDVSDAGPGDGSVWPVSVKVWTLR